MIEGGAEAANDWIRGMLVESLKNSDKRKTKKADPVPATDDEESSARGLRAFNAHEVVVAGVSWLWRLTLDRPTDAQVGMVLSALAKLPAMRVAGGHAKGYGQVVLDDVRVGGASVWSAGGFAGGLDRYFDALAGELDSMNADGFEQFVKSSAQA